MNILIIDWMNLVKRYIYTSELAELEVGEVTQKLTYSILNRIDKLFFLTKPDLVFICSDCGFNKRAAGIVEGYKQNRKKYKSLTVEEREKSYREPYQDFRRYTRDLQQEKLSGYEHPRPVGTVRAEPGRALFILHK